jgi:hypothetical protein
MHEPNYHIYYSDKISRRTGGQLDVDMNAGGRMSRTPVENIFYARQSDLPHGSYALKVNQYNRRESVDVGFDVEIDVLGTVHRFSYANAVAGTIDVAKLIVSASGIRSRSDPDVFASHAAGMGAANARVPSRSRR